jgi:hypothetical protein
MTQDEYYPASLEIEYPDRELDRITTFLRPIVFIPIGIVLGLLNGPAMHGSRDRAAGDDDPTFHLASVGVVFLPTVLMLLFRRKYPRWWFDWNLELMRFGNRVVAYLALMDDRYPSTEEPQAVQLDIPYPDAERDLSRWLPLVKWLLALPHYLILFVLSLAAVLAVIVAWFAILVLARYPRTLFEFVEGVLRWHNRVVAYAFVLVTDRYPPFTLA